LQPEPIPTPSNQKPRTRPQASNKPDALPVNFGKDSTGTGGQIGTNWKRPI
jgi:hypothetical protein